MYAGTVVAIIAGALTLIAYRNQRSAERSWLRVVLQVALLGAIVGMTLTAGMLLGV